MKRLFRFLSIFALLATVGSGCSTTQAAQHKFVGAAAQSGYLNMFWVPINSAAIVAAGNNGVTTIFDTTSGGTVSNAFLSVYRMMLVGYCTDQDVTALYQVQLPGSSTWVTAAGTNASFVMNHSGATPPIATEIDELVQGHESRIKITNGATGPASCNFGLALFYTRELGQ